MMKQVLILILFVSIFTSCKNADKNKEVFYERELFFKMITIGSDVFGMKDKLGCSLYERYEALEDDDLADQNVKYLKDYFDFLKLNDLFGKPYVQIASSKPKVEFETVYMDDLEFEKLKEFKLSDLRNNNQKVIVSFYGNSIWTNTIRCSRIESVELMDGETRWKK